MEALVSLPFVISIPTPVHHGRCELLDIYQGSLILTTGCHFAIYAKNNVSACGISRDESGNFTQGYLRLTTNDPAWSEIALPPPADYRVFYAQLEWTPNTHFKPGRRTCEASALHA